MGKSLISYNPMGIKKKSMCRNPGICLLHVCAKAPDVIIECSCKIAIINVPCMLVENYFINQKSLLLYTDF